MEKRNVWKTKWSGEWPALCCGEWSLYHNGKEIDNSIIPFCHSPANTYGSYSWRFFDDDWLDNWNWYEDGLEEGEWIKENESWLSKIAKPEDYPKIFEAFQENDWRMNSCGGCI